MSKQLPINVLALTQAKNKKSSAYIYNNGCKLIYREIEGRSDRARRIYTCVWQQQRKQSDFKLSDRTHSVMTQLKEAGYKWSLGNDAPRGGKEGDYIQVYSMRALQVLKDKLTQRQ